ncbi:uncharacterized protein LOC111077426 [Drosophila obscura]|uniref:uncharacterized protein LOC111077426 n=1 Tax=Drosophila obscura TaxID=7282 RepID=UPI001BB1DBCF|nr:uncharacterized protein LOC111077426 [Drosophila obscura]
MGGRGRGRGRGGGSSMEISSEENTHSSMAGDVANAERDSAARAPRAQQQWQMELVDATWAATLVGDNIALSTRIGAAKSGDTSEDELADREDDGPVYSLFDGDADAEAEADIDNDDAGICGEESMALLAHEMLCCSDSETENDKSEGNYTIRACQKLDGSLQYGLHNPYQLMDNDEEPEKDVQLKKINERHAAVFQYRKQQTGAATKAVQLPLPLAVPTQSAGSFNYF